MGFKIAVSGLKAATADLDVTGNNIANGNTVGFKKSRAQFADIYAVSNLGSSQDSIGQGVQVSAVAQQFSQGNVSFTDNSLDLAVNGQGFFALETHNGSRVYSRAGQFGVDKDGYIVNSTGQNLLAFGASSGVITGAVAPLQLDTSILPPSASTQVDVEVNLDASETVPAAFDPTDGTTYNSSTSLTVFDSLGAEHLATVYFRKTGTNSWETHVRVDNDNTQTLATQNLTFDSNGDLTAPAGNVNYGVYTPSNGAAPITLNYGFAGTTQVGADFGVYSLGQDGYTSGQLTGIDIDQDGTVLARFSNGESQAQGQIVLANFGNAQGLQPVSETNWAETNASGAALIGAPGSASLGLLQAGAVEESNVDISSQLVNMIIAQRNFQANAQMIRAEDETTQTIINIR